MARRIFQVTTFTPTATADNTTLVNGTYMAVGNSITTGAIKVHEIQIGGQATASAVNIMLFARNMVLGVTPTALVAPNSDGAMHRSTLAIANPQLCFVAAGTGPSRSNNTFTPKLNMTFNAWGGTVKWYDQVDQEWWIIGQEVNFSETSLSAFTGGNVGPVGAHIILENL